MPISLFEWNQEMTSMPEVRSVIRRICKRTEMLSEGTRPETRSESASIPLKKEAQTRTIERSRRLRLFGGEDGGPVRLDIVRSCVAGCGLCKSLSHPTITGPKRPRMATMIWARPESIFTLILLPCCSAYTLFQIEIGIRRS